MKLDRSTALPRLIASALGLAVGLGLATCTTSPAHADGYVTSITVHPESNHPLAQGTWAWTPDVGYPVVAAWAPSQAAAKIGALTVGDSVHLAGELAGDYLVVPEDGRTDHDLYLQRVAPSGHVDQFVADLVYARSAVEVLPEFTVADVGPWMWNGKLGSCLITVQVPHLWSGQIVWRHYPDVRHTVLSVIDDHGRRQTRSFVNGRLASVTCLNEAPRPTH